MRLRRAAHVLAAVITTGVGAVTLVGTGQATASAGITGCPTGYACIWEDSNYHTVGTQQNSYKFQIYQAHFGRVNFANTNHNAGDEATSAYNAGTGGEKAWFYKDAQCQGAHFSVSANTGDKDFRNGSPAGDFNDELSSGAFTSTISRCYSGT